MRSVSSLSLGSPCECSLAIGHRYHFDVIDFLCNPLYLIFGTMRLRQKDRMSPSPAPLGCNLLESTGIHGKREWQSSRGLGSRGRKLSCWLFGWKICSFMDGTFPGVKKSALETSHGDRRHVAILTCVTVGFVTEYHYTEMFIYTSASVSLVTKSPISEILDETVVPSSHS